MIGAAVKIRPATNADRGPVSRLIFSVLAEYGLRPSPDSTDADLADLDAHYIKRGGCFDVLVDDDDHAGAAGTRIVGTVALFRVDDQTCELRKMYLSPADRGRGWGKRLLDHALSQARELGFRRVTLETASVLVEAIALYRSRGFRPFAAERLAPRCDQAYELDLAPARVDSD
jgi:putative acetyltransferase